MGKNMIISHFRLQWRRFYSTREYHKEKYIFVPLIYPNGALSIMTLLQREVQNRACGDILL